MNRKTPRDVFDALRRDIERRLGQFGREVVINLRNQVTGQLPNGNIAPIDLEDNNIFHGVLGVDQGGTGIDASSEGPGVVKQNAEGEAFVIEQLGADELDWSGMGTGAVLRYNSGDPEFQAVDMTDISWPVPSGGSGVLDYNGGNPVFKPMQALTVEEIDGTPSVDNVSVMEFSNGSVTDMGGGVVRINVAAGGGTVIVSNEDGTVTEPSASELVVGLNDLVPLGGGVVRIKTASDASANDSAGSKLYMWENFR